MLGDGLVIGQSRQWMLAVAMTAMVWLSATGNVGLGIAAFSAIEPAPSTGCRPPAFASEPITPNTGILAHKLPNDRLGAFDLNAILPVRVALLLLMLGLVA